MKAVNLTSVMCTGLIETNKIKKSQSVQSDIVLNQLQSFRVQSYQVNQNEEEVEITLNIQFLEDKIANRDYATVDNGVFDLFKYKKARNNNIRVETKAADILFYNEGKYKKLSNIYVSDSEEASHIKAKFNIKDLLNEEDYSNYLSGKSITSNFDFNLKRLIEVSSSGHKETYDQSYGGFRATIEVK